jgi:leucyl-tRNA synthetase
MAVAAEHPLALAAGARDPALQAFIDECRRGSTMEADVATMEKKGRPTGLHVRHPFTDKPIEVWVANYVLMGYGEGAVMGVPAHDERDFEFASQNGIAIRTVVRPEGVEWQTVEAPWQPSYGEQGLTIDSGDFTGLGFQAAVDAITAALSP